MMNAMAAARQAELRQCRVRLAADLTAPRGARVRVRAAIAEWGTYRTPAGLAWFFTLAFMPDLAVGHDRDSQGNSGGDGEA